MSKRIQRKQLDEVLLNVGSFPTIAAPARGWLHAIRQSLGMPLRTLADRIGVTPQAIERIEKREADRSITLASLQSAAETLDCLFVYAIVPKRPLEETLHKAAEQAADAMMKGVDQSMDLEGQSVEVSGSREELILKLENNPRLIWRWVK
ncbi:MAG: mobile mystery protein A [Bacteroidota bacterium]|nr:mobile mystery protein A [Bacteroidota bacterium]MDP4233409.1 mobile mystery protein A [Bacteroidota bacterium]MDP4242275.1 mobile mystery protein A [Bacteroidota bacterium]MDP4287031.1 mobile mystery protein A [Bacteroidota bacterium]